MPSTTFTTSTTRSSSRGVASPHSSFIRSSSSLILKPKPVERTSSAVFAGLDVDRIPDVGQVPRSYNRAPSPFLYLIDDLSSTFFVPDDSLSSKTRELRPTNSFRSGTPTVDSRTAREDVSSLDRWEEDAKRTFKPGDEFTSPSPEMLLQEFGPAAPDQVEYDDDEDLEISDTERSRHSMCNNYEFRVQHQTTRKSPAPMHNSKMDDFVYDRRDDLVQDRHVVDSPVNLSRVQHQTTRKSPAPMHHTKMDDFVYDRRDDVVQYRHVVDNPVHLSNAPHHTSPNCGRLPRAAKSRALTARELLAGKTNKPGLMNDAVIYCSSEHRRASVKAAPKLRSSRPSKAPPAQSRVKKVTQPRRPKQSTSHATQSIPAQRSPVPPPRQPGSSSEHIMKTRSTWRCPHGNCHYKTGIPEDAHAHYATHTETHGSASRSSARSAAYY